MLKQCEIIELLRNKKEVLLNNEPNNAICYDGIVNEQLYENIVVLLKETNGTAPDGEMPDHLEDWDYYRWLKDQQVDNKPEERINKKGEKYIEQNVFYPSTFRKLCYWLCLLFDTLENESVDPNKYMNNGQVDVENVRKILDRVAIVNLKKSWGQKQTNSKALEEYVAVSEISEILRKQMGILSPRIVLCCSPTVYWLATKVYTTTDIFSYKVASKSIPGKNIEFARMNDTVYVSFYHPQYYGKTDEQFSNYAVETFAYLKEYLKN